MAAVISIKVETSGGLDAVKKDVEDLGKTAESSGGGFNALQEMATGALRKIGEVAINLAGAAFGALSSAVQDGIADAQENAKIQAQTAQVLKSTGNAAGKTAEQIADYASSLSDAAGTSLFGDDQIQQSTNLLLTFTNIRGASLDAATAISVDMAQALGGAPKDAAIQLGKALNDPVKGITALTRVGVTFSDEQKAQIQAMQEAGDTAGAQAVILAELNKEFGGSAKAAADATGGWSEFNGRMGEAKEALGAAVLPLLTQLAGVLNDTILPIVEDAAAAFGPFIADLMQSYDEGGIVGLLNNIAFALTGTVGAFNPLMDAIDVFIAAWPQMMAQIQPVIDFISANLVPILSGLAAMIIAVAVPAFTAWASAAYAAATATIAAMLPVVWPILAIGAAVALLVAAWQNDWGGIQEKVAAVWSVIQPIFDAVVLWLQTNIPIAIQKASDFWNNTLWPALQKVWAFIQDNVIPIIVKIATDTFAMLNDGVKVVSTFWTETLWPALQKVWQFIQDDLMPILTALANVAIALVKKEVELLAALWNNVLWPALNKVWQLIQDNVMPILKDLSEKAMAGVETVSKSLASVWNDTLSPAFSKLYDFVYTYLQPLLDRLNEYALKPMKSFFADIGNSVRDLIDWLHDLAEKIDAIEVPDWLQGHSPPPMANWFSDIGGAIGMVNQQLPDLAMNLAAQVGPGGQSITNTASTRSFTYAPTVTSYGGHDMPMDLALASSLAGV